ncbi:hypothetical protein ACFJIW_15440 [Tahibacter sp. UC22_41]|uniref:hypothetical protein n=1 Tax=Tahibacter sp. UC22_41 TaxID=3350178 RepID=UPI0036DB618D
MFHHRFLLRAAALLLLVLPGLSPALSLRCVATPQQLTAAFNDAMASSDSPFLIQLRQGDYVFDSDTNQLPVLNLVRPGQSIEISGGWSGSNGNCTTSSPGAGSTRLVFDSPRAMRVEVTGAGGVQFSLHDLTLTSPNQKVLVTSACLETGVATGNAATIERLRLLQCRAAVPSVAAPSGEFSNNGGDMLLRNIVVSGGEADYNGGMVVTTLVGGHSRLSHLSITATRATDAGAGFSGLQLISDASSRVDLGNSVIWGNDPRPGIADFSLIGPSAHLSRVHIGRIGKENDIPAENIAPGSGDPGFIAVGDARLRADSLLVDTGALDPAGGSGDFDVEGRARSRGLRVDVGAYETPEDVIFRTNFD